MNIEKNKYIRFFPLLGLVLVAIYLFFKFPHFIIDDAFITARYAHNLAYHGELTWNVGKDPVEGYTGVLLPALLAVVMKITNAEFITLPVIYGMAGFLTGGILLWWFLDRNKAPIVLQTGLLGLYSLAPCLHTHIFAGLETFIFIAFTAAATWKLFDLLKQTRDFNVSELAIILLLAALTRPEGLALAMIYLLTAAIWVWKRKSEVLGKFILRAALFCVVPYAIYFIWRWQYYGYLLPNTYYIKTSSGISWSVLENFIRFARIYLTVPFVTTLIALALGFRLKAKNKQEGKYNPQYYLWPFFIGVTSYIVLTLLVYLRNELIMDYAFRFYVPFFLPLLMLSGMLITRGYNFLTISSRNRLVYSGLFGLFCLVWVSGAYLPEYFREKRIAKAYIASINSLHIPAGKELREIIPPNEWLAVVTDAGAIPYYSELPTLDFGGLSDETIAHSQKPFDELEYLFRNTPGALALISYSADYFVRNTGMDKINQHDSFANYELYKIYKPPLSESDYYGSYYLFVYIRRDLMPPIQSHQGIINSTKLASNSINEP